jgi:hypothetical protein
MKNRRSNRSSNQCRGEGLVVVIILVAIVGGGVWWLFSTKKQSDREARAFGREVVEKITVQRDKEFLANNLAPSARQLMTKSQQEYLITKFAEMGTPAQPIKIDENVTFESHFFSPHGFFTAHLNYPTQPVELQVAISHPVGKWQIDDLTINWKPR